MPPEETVARVKTFAAAFGITRIANLTGLDRTGIPVAMVCRPNARSSAVFNGKGVDIVAAQASALMEAAETWHAENVRLPLQFGSFADLSGGHSLVDVDGLPRTPGTEFDSRMPILWVEGRNLMDNGAIWLPFEIVHADSRIPGAPMSGCFSMSTNGLASGNRLLEAVSHALCEIIERDATSIWHQSPHAEQDARRLDLATIDDANSLAILDLLAKAQLDVGVWDITTDLGVCAFYCMIVDRVDELGHIGVGAACHPARGTALLRAVLEAAQVRTTYIIGSREDIEQVDYDPATLGRRNAEVRALMRPSGCSSRFQVGRERGVRDIRSRGGLAFRQTSIDRTKAGSRRRSDAAGICHTGGANGCSRSRRVGSSPFAVLSRTAGTRRARAAVVTLVVFVGPTLEPRDLALAGGFVGLPPVSQGDVYRAAKSRPRAIGIIDGYFSGAPSVWHKEILWAISEGVPVFGSASMGALRAAELHSFGMRGVGRIFESFRDGALEDDDEVAVLHGPAEIGYLAASEPMVNIRETLALAESEWHPRAEIQAVAGKVRQGALFRRA